MILTTLLVRLIPKHIRREDNTVVLGLIWFILSLVEIGIYLNLMGFKWY